ncbi:MAG TPA: GNAT family N-acetyltransferase [Rhizomicrobium sp.]|jgi:ribosomal-protein-alanine N-acetyltransferase|nr:GNAT family N-acetyltransferase [Rhizomicrobium sp.]
MGVPTLETARLVLRPLQLSDAAATQALFAHWGIVRYVPDIPWPYPADGAESYYRNVALPQMEKGTAWRWSLRLKSAPEELIGAIHLMDGDNNRFFWLGIAWQGQGLMTEACEAATQFWFTTLERPLLRTNKAALNTASRRISERGGMRVVAVETKDYPAGPLPTQICEITREEWLAGQAKK